MHFLHPEKYSLATDFDLNGEPKSADRTKRRCREILHLLSCHEDEQREAKILDLQQKLEPILLRRLKSQVIKDLPTKSERILRVEMSTMQVNIALRI